MAEEKEDSRKTKAGKAIEEAKEKLIDLAVSYLNTESGLEILGVGDEELELFLRDKERRNQLIKDNTPKIEEYEITGRIFDKQTGEPIVGAKVNPLLCQFSSDTKPQTDKGGKFKVKVNVPVLEKGTAILKSQFFFTKENYIPTTQNLLNGDSTIKTDLPTFSLTNTNKIAETISNGVQIQMDKGVQKLSNIFLSGIDKIIILRRKSISKFTNVIKLRLLPLAIEIFVLFGVVKIQDVGKKTCPSPEALAQAIKKRNSIVKQLNQIYKILIVNSALAAVVLYISFQLRGLISTINNIPIPLSVPPGVGVPASFILKLESLKDKLKEFSDDNKKLSKQVLISLLFLVVAIVIILIYLKSIDGMIKECSVEANLTPLSPELEDIRKQNEEDTTPSPTTTNVNGFTFDVVEDKREVGSLKRRYAIAKNNQGVIMLKGEPSFSASDQILIDELIFYIQSNNLKAN